MRVAVTLLALAFVVIRRTYERRYPPRRPEHYDSLRQRALVAGVAAGYFIPVPLWLGGYLTAAQLPWPAALRWLGLPLGLVGLALFVWTHHWLGANFSPLLQLQAGHRLVVGGPYRRVRHPMYTALFLIWTGTNLLCSNLLVLIPSFSTLLLLYSARVRHEEAMMCARFPTEYPDYMRRTGRLFPRTGFRV